MSVVSVPPQTPEPEISFSWHIVVSPEDKGTFVLSVSLMLVWEGNY